MLWKNILNGKQQPGILNIDIDTHMANGLKMSFFLTNHRAGGSGKTDLLYTGLIWFAEMENRLSLHSQQKTALRNHFLFSRYWENNIAENRKQNLPSMDQIVHFMFNSDNDTDLGEHSSDKSDLDSNWECK